MTGWWSGRRLLLLLILSVAMLIVAPIAARLDVAGRVVVDVMIAGIGWLAVRAIPWRAWPRRVGLIALAAAIAATLGYYATGALPSSPIAVAYHVAMSLFLGCAVVAILREILSKQRIAIDDVFGAVVGYLFGALGWAQLYALAELFAPGAFVFAPELASQFDDWHLRRAMFDYLSFTTLTSIGWSDVTPRVPPATTLMWLEVVGGQFYMAIVVATLVGQKLVASRLRDSDRE